MAKFKRKLKKAVKKVRKVVDKVLKHASPNTQVGVNVTIQINTGATPVNQSTHNQAFKHKELNSQKQVENKSTEKSNASTTYVTPSGIIKITKLPKIEPINKEKVESSNTTVKKQDKKSAVSTSVSNKKNENKKTVVSTANQKSPIELNLSVPSKLIVSNDKNIFVNNRFIAQQGMVSDRVNRQDYSLKEFSRKYQQAYNIYLNNRNSNSSVFSPFSNKRIPYKQFVSEFEQVMFAADQNKELFKIAKDIGIATINEYGQRLKNKDVGRFLLQAGHKLSSAEKMYDVFEFTSYVSKGDLNKAENKLKDIVLGSAGAVIGSKIGALMPNRFKAIGAIAGSLAGGYLAGTEDGRNLVLGNRNNKIQFPKGNFDNLDMNRINQQAEMLKHSMSNFNHKSIGEMNTIYEDIKLDMISSPH